jgi:hypothetical protein
MIKAGQIKEIREEIQRECFQACKNLIMSTIEKDITDTINTSRVGIFYEGYKIPSDCAVQLRNAGYEILDAYTRKNDFFAVYGTLIYFGDKPAGIDDIHISEFLPYEIQTKQFEIMTFRETDIVNKIIQRHQSE